MGRAPQEHWVMVPAGHLSKLEAVLTIMEAADPGSAGEASSPILVSGVAEEPSATEPSLRRLMARRYEATPGRCPGSGRI